MYYTQMSSRYARGYNPASSRWHRTAVLFGHFALSFGRRNLFLAQFFVDGALEDGETGTLIHRLVGRREQGHRGDIPVEVRRFGRTSCPPRRSAAQFVPDHAGAPRR